MTDGVHPSLEGVKCLVAGYRDEFSNSGLNISEAEITMRAPPARNTIPQSISRVTPDNFSTAFSSAWQQVYGGK